MQYKNPNLNLPTKDRENERKSPLNVRLPTSQNAQPLSMNLSRTQSNSFNVPQRSTIDSTHQNPLSPIPSNPSHQNTQNQNQTNSGTNSNFFAFPSDGSNNNPLKTTFVNQTNQNNLVSSIPLTNQGLNTLPYKTPVQQNNTPVSGMGSNFHNISSQSNQRPLPGSPNDTNGGGKALSEANFRESNITNTVRNNGINEQSRFQSNVTGIRNHDLNDNTSYHSKVSTNSRNHVLRAISVNNEDHLVNLVNKEDALKNQNILMVNNFLQNLDGTKRNVLRNMSDNFKARVHEIWSSYLNDQMRTAPPTLDTNLLNGDVETIKKVFLDFLLVKTDIFVEELKQKAISDVFRAIEQVNSQKQYLDEGVQFVVENQYSTVKSKNIELRDKVEEAKGAYKGLIDQTVQKYEKLREAHIDMYDREFAFKLNGDQNLVVNTLKNAVPFLKEQNRKIDEKLNNLRPKNSAVAANAIQKEIEMLENEIKFLKGSKKTG